MSTINSIPTWRKWIVVLASFFIHAIIWGLAFGSGIFQVIFVHEFSQSGLISQISLVCSLIPTFTCLTGPLSSILTNKFGCRIVGIFGSLVASTALFSTYFAYSVPFLLAAFSFLGIGLGIAYVPSVVIICKYFDEKRPLAMALAGSGLGVGTLLTPPIIQSLVDHWHWRNAAIILSAIILNIGACSALFYEPNGGNDKTAEENNKLGPKKILRVKMLKRPAFLGLLINNFLILFGLVAFYVHLPTHLEESGSVDDDFSAAMLVSVVGAGTIAGRVISGFVLQCLTYPTAAYASTMGLGGFLMICVPFVRNYYFLFIILFSFGVFTSTLGPLLPLIITDMVGVNSLSDGYGYVLVAEAFGSLLGPPFAGYLYDVCHNYTYSMSFSGIMIILASIIIAIPQIHISRIFRIKEQRTHSTENDQSVVFIDG